MGGKSALLLREKAARTKEVLASIGRTALFPYREQMVVTLIYRCPRTGLQVQGVAANHATDCEIYEPVTCTACARVHLVNPKSGKVLESSQK
jgi:hypothetical protein